MQNKLPLTTYVWLINRVSPVAAHMECAQNVGRIQGFEP